jgi:hypothetical protein
MSRTSASLLAAGVAALLVAAATTLESHVPVPAVDRPAIYVVSVVAVDTSNRDGYVRWIAGAQRPVWQRLKQQNVLADAYVYEVREVLSAQPNVPSWNLLLVRHVAQGSGKEFLKQEEALLNHHTDRSAVPFTLRRVEVLRSTPNSYYPEPTPANRARETEARWNVEYVNVNHIPEALHEYREAMRQPIGPAVGEHVRSGYYYNFIALETESVEFAEADMADWNQIHFNGGFAQTKPAPRSAEVQAVFNRLPAIRTRTRTDEVVVISELTVR